jgi:dienelactone hydrolase
MPKLIAAIMFCLLALSAAPARAEEFTPPSAKGRVVIMLSGQSGPDQYRQLAGLIAEAGYDVVLLDTKSLMGTHGQALRDAIAAALQSPHALPGKVGFIGLSLGGGLAIEYGPGWDDQVALVVAWYPATGFVTDPTAWSANLRVPVFVFTGEADTFNDCCTLEKQKALAALAQAHGASYELTTYPGVNHGFAIGGPGYRADANADALKRTQAALAQYLSN